MRDVSTAHVYTVILGGGRGSRLYPLTRDRAKPAVPLGAKYRLIDIPLSNAINSGFRNIAVLTQFNSASLNSHISSTYHFDIFGRGKVEVFAAQQTEAGYEWFEGTADAVRKLFSQSGPKDFDHVLILSGDHLYRMDYREMVAQHLETGADITVSALPVSREDCEGFGVLSANPEGRIHAFKEKPKVDENLSALVPPEPLQKKWGLAPDQYLASMGVYVFKMSVLKEALEKESNLDFGGDILPSLIDTHGVYAFVFPGYWRDIGTIASFYEANLALTEESPRFRFNHPEAPIYTAQRFLPATKVGDARISRSILSDGCLIFGTEIDHSVIGVRSRLQKGSRVLDSILMGNDFYEDDEVRAANLAKGIDAAGVGPDCIIERAIIDKNARIGPGCILRGHPNRPDQDGDNWFVRDGIVIVPKNAALKPGTVV